MRSGNGKHRRPRQAPAVLVSAGATGAGLALPLLGAGGAQAADADTWDRVAQCESGGVWSADIGNGYFGGLQITLKTWQEFGGTEYAERPDLASRSQQIAVAERILAAKGPDAWPRCADRAGLTADETASPSVDPGEALLPEDDPEDGGGSDTGDTGEGTPPTGDDAAREDTADTEGAADTESGEGTEGGEDAAPAPSPSPSRDARQEEERAEDTADPDTTAPAPGDSTRPPSGRTSPRTPGGLQETGRPDPGEGTGRHRGPRDPREVAQEERERQRASDGRAHRHRPVPSSYVVRPGDSLWAIAARYQLPGGWPALYEANRDVVGEDPDLIYPGQRFDLTVGDPRPGEGDDARPAPR